MMWSKYGTNTHYPCGHERTKANSATGGNGRWRCRECANANRKRSETRKRDTKSPYVPYKPV